MRSSTLGAILFWVAILLVVLIDPYVMDTDYGEAFYLFTVVAIAALILNWFLSDAREHSLEPSALLKICVIVLPVIAVPYYLIKYKGLKRALLSFAKFGALFVGAVFLMTLVSTLSGQNA